MCPIGDFMMTKLGGKTRPMIAIAGSIVVIIMLTCSYAKELKMNCTTFVWFYSIALGIFRGSLYSPLLRAGYSHLSGRKGLVSGIIISGYGFGGFLFGELAQLLCNPGGKYHFILDYKNEKSYLPKEVGDKVPHMLRMFSLVMIIFIITSLLIVTNFD